MRIVYLPLEPLDRRYTKQWWGWFKEVFEAEGVDYLYVYPKEVEVREPSPREFLDIRDTSIWKFMQLIELFRREHLEEDDVVFLADGEFWGSEALAYYRQFSGRRFKIASVWHAGTYDTADLTFIKGCEGFGKYFELGWFEMTDKIFVASAWHKQLLQTKRMVPKAKIAVTGLPADVEGLNAKYGQNPSIPNRIVFAGRLAWEKGYDVVKKLRREGFDIYATLEHDLSKEQYYDMLSRASVLFSPARQETFGYAVVEALSMNVPVVVPDGLSYTDYVPYWMRYDGWEMMLYLLKRFMKRGKHPNLYRFVQKYQYQAVIKKMVDEMRGLVNG